MPLYPEQRTWLDAVDAALDFNDSVIGQAPVSFGKTQCFVTMAGGAVRAGHRVLVIAPTLPLIEQTSARFLQMGLVHGFIAGELPEVPEASIQIATPHSLALRWNRYGKPRFTQVIEDEAHNATSPRYRDLHGKLAGIGCDQRIGVSATPCNLNGTGMGVSFQVMVPGPQPGHLIDIGRLAKPIVYSPPVVTDFSSLKKGGGDYTLLSQQVLLNRKHISADALKQYEKLTPGKQAIVFCSTIQHCYDMAEVARSRGHKCEVLEGGQNRKEREDIVDRFQKKEYQLLFSCQLILEGFDCPGAEVVIFVRKTVSLRIFIQAIGRVMRSDGGRKKFCYVIDCVGNVYRHGMPDADREWSLLGGSGRATFKSDLKQCKQCFMWCNAVDLVCRCGAAFEKKVQIFRTIESGELAEVVDIKPKARTKMSDFKAEAKGISKDDPNGLEKIWALCLKYGYKKGFGTRYWKMKSGGIKAIREMQWQNQKKKVKS